MARMTAVLERIAGTEEAACLRMLDECPAFRDTLDEAPRLEATAAVALT